MPPEAWQAISAIVAALAAAGSAVSVAMISRQRGQLKRGAEAAEAARDNTVPTSNGFAKDTTTTLAEIARRSRRNEQTLEWVTTALGRHLAAHSAGVACPAGLLVVPPAGELPTDESPSASDHRSH